MSETTIINGQPQGLGNRMVTHDGLVDFLKMLKREIPRMGVGNTIAENATFSYAFGNMNELGETNTARSGNSFIFGAQNKVQQNTFNNVYILGSHNHSIRAEDSFDSISNVYVLGNSNTNINNARQVYILGDQNTAQGNSYTESLHQAYGFGSNLTLTSNAVWLGQYNKPVENVVFGIGNGSYDKKENLFTIGKNGCCCNTSFQCTKPVSLIMQKATFNNEVALTTTFKTIATFNNIYDGLYLLTVNGAYTSFIHGDIAEDEFYEKIMILSCGSHYFIWTSSGATVSPWVSDILDGESGISMQISHKSPDLLQLSIGMNKEIASATTMLIDLVATLQPLSFINEKQGEKLI